MQVFRIPNDVPNTILKVAASVSALEPSANVIYGWLPRDYLTPKLYC